MDEDSFDGMDMDDDEEPDAAEEPHGLAAAAAAVPAAAASSPQEEDRMPEAVPSSIAVPTGAVPQELDAVQDDGRPAAKREGEPSPDEPAAKFQALDTVQSMPDRIVSVEGPFPSGQRS